MKKFLSLFKKSAFNRSSFKGDLKKRPIKVNVSGDPRLSYKGIVYSKYAKRKVSQIPGLMSSFLEMVSLNKREVSVNVLSKFKTPVTLTLRKIDKPSLNSFATNNFFIFEINTKSNSKKFFVKNISSKDTINFGFNGANEMVALSFIKKAGFNVIPAHLGYVNQVKGTSYIFYEYQSRLVDAEVAYKNKQITKKDIFIIRRNLKNIQKEVNTFINSFLRTKKNLPLIKDVYPHKRKSFEAVPVFIDLETKKLYIYDPIMANIF